MFEVFQNVTAVFRDLTVRNGLATGFGQSTGGGILSLGQSTVTLDRVVVEECTARGNNGTDGIPGGINKGSGGYGNSAQGGGIANGGTMTLIQSLVRKDLAQGGKGGNGAYAPSDELGGGGGSALGGGIFNDGSLTLLQSALVDNLAQGGAGGDGGPTPVNTGYDAGAGGRARGGGLYVSEFATQVQIINSTLARNKVLAGFGGGGGSGGNLGNPLIYPGSPGGSGGNGGLAQGGAIAALARFSLDNSTIALNESHHGVPGQGGPGGAGNPPGRPGNDGHSVGDEGGGIWAPGANPGDTLITAVSSLIANNTDDDSDGPDVKGNFASPSQTLLGIADGAGGISDGSGGNIVGKDPKLGPLQDNGGPTPTFALLPGSPAINAGSNPLNLSADQRGYTPRAAGGAVDIGAFESGATAPPPGTGGGGGGGGGGGTTSVQLTVKLVKVKRRRQVQVFNTATGSLRFAVYPFGKAYRGTFQVQQRDVNGDGIPDVIAQRPGRHHKLISVIFSGLDGSPLPSSLA